MLFLKYKNLNIFLLLAIFFIIAKLGYSKYLTLHHPTQTPKRIIFLESKGFRKGSSKGLESMYKEMKKDGHDVKIASIDLSLTDKFPEEDIIYPCGKSEPYKCESLDKYKPEYIFIHNPYDYYGTFSSFRMEGESNLGLIKLKETGAKIMYIPYAPCILWQYNIIDPILPTVVDTVFVDSYSAKEIYKKYYKFPTNKVIVSGYQTYYDIRTRLQTKKDDKIETILWLPRWFLTTYNRHLYEGGSTFLNYHYFFYNYALEHPNVNFIIRPHGNLVEFGIINKFFTQEEIDQLFNRFKSLKNVRISEHANNSLVDDILESDIVIADFTSALAETMIADKPIIYLSNGWNTEFNSNKLSEELRKYIYFAHSPDQIISNIEKIRKNNYLPFYEKSCDTITCRLWAINNKIWGETSNRDEFKKMLDPVEYPAKFISNYLLNLPKD